MSGAAVRAGEAFVEVGLKSRIKEGVRQIQNQLSAVSSSFQSVGTGLASAGATATAAFGGIVASLAWPTMLAANMETTRAGFLAMLRDGGKVNQLMADLSKFGAETPFEFPELADAARMLIAFGIPLQDVITTLRQVGDVSSGINAPLGEIAEIYGKARVQGRLFMEDINQLTGRGIPIFEALAKQFGVTEGEVRKLVESGQVNFSHLQRAFADLTTGAGAFTGQMAAKSKTLIGLFSTLKDNIGMALAPVGEAISNMLKPVIALASAAIQPIGAFIAANAKLIATIGAIAAVGAAVGVALLTVGTTIVGIGGAIGGLAALMPAITAGFTAVAGVGATVVPVLLAIAAGVAAVMALGGAFAYIANRAGILQPAFSALWDLFGKLGTTASETFGGIASTLSDGKVAQAAQILWAGLKVAFFTGAKAAYDGFVWLVQNGTQLLYKFGTAVGQTIFDIFSQIPRLIQAALTGQQSVLSIIAETLKGNLGNALEGQIQAAQAELTKLTANPAAKSSAPATVPTPQTGTAKLSTSVEDSSKKAFEDRAKALREEITEMKLGADTAELLKLQQEGLNQAQLVAIAQLQQQRNALAEQKRAQEEASRKAEESKRKAEEDRQQLIDRGKQMAEEVRTPFETLQAKMAEIGKMEAGGFIDRRTANRQREMALGEFNAPMRDAIKSGRNNVAEINSQAALDIILRNQRTFGMGTPGANKKSPLEEYAKQQRDYLRTIAENAGKTQNGITVKTQRI